ncbi:MAG: ZIP family metal transporter [Candidatus Omnitrophica bacterium]|nr:ZIP family metal transporter [Candidatus Omnitrophota bacterium]MDD5352515.1 ZIP family metal transporter [Candidatus Omnitrophota bacterium]MDD5550113.1 ZIP family metal transporter [Candidatus Omnitrophota bacterium]
MVLVWAISASIIVSLISFVGIFALLLKGDMLNEILIVLIGFSAGGLIGGAFLHLLPEALEHSTEVRTFSFTIIGFIAFFILERYFYWRHCHEEKCDIHTFTYLSLVGDGIHNFIDGLIIGTSFMVGIKVGIIATLAIVMHEIPQELGDFGILIYGGFSRFKAFFYNFLSALTAVIGTIVGYYFSSKVSDLSSFILPFAAGGFIYIASCDLVPELHKQKNAHKANVSLLFFILGILLMVWLKTFGGH